MQRPCSSSHDFLQHVWVMPTLISFQPLLFLSLSYSSSNCLVWYEICPFCDFSVPIISLRLLSDFHDSPDDVEDCRYEQLVVDGHGDVTRFVESRRHGSDSVAQVHAPKQEQEFSCQTGQRREKRGQKYVHDGLVLWSYLLYCRPQIHIQDRLTHSHHVVPSVQQTNAKLEGLWSEACGDQSPT